MGILEIGFSLGAAAGALLGGFIFDVTGSYARAFAVAVVAMLVTTILMAFTRRETVIGDSLDKVATMIA